MGPDSNDCMARSTGGERRWAGDHLEEELKSDPRLDGAQIFPVRP